MNMVKGLPVVVGEFGAPPDGDAIDDASNDDRAPEEDKNGDHDMCQ